LEEARKLYGPRALLRNDHNGRWRPVFPQARHNLPPDAYRQQLAIYVAWKNRHLTRSEASSSMTKNTNTNLEKDGATNHDHGAPKQHHEGRRDEHR